MLHGGPTSEVHAPPQSAPITGRIVTEEDARGTSDGGTTVGAFGPALPARLAVARRKASEPFLYAKASGFALAHRRPGTGFGGGRKMAERLSLALSECQPSGQGASSRRTTTRW